MVENVLIVGGSSDIGLQVAKNLIGSGVNVTLFARDQSRLEEVTAMGAHAIIGDARKVEDFDNVIAHFEGEEIHGVVHCVGSIALRPPHAMKVEDFSEVIETNLTTAFITLSKVGKKMLKSGGGRMVFVTSVAGSYGLTNHEAISAAKGGLEAMVRSAASTYAQRGIRVNAVAPGLTRTRLSEAVRRSEAVEAAAIQLIPTKKMNEITDISTTIEWLLTKAPDTMTGEIVHIDGGMSNIRG
jgi:NAD(P)-dependent dehydrogenase (short-subunit alcohol dehydrogenase family)